VMLNEISVNLSFLNHYVSVMFRPVQYSWFGGLLAFSNMAASKYETWSILW
jgi:hypothetical protein